MRRASASSGGACSRAWAFSNRARSKLASRGLETGTSTRLRLGPGLRGARLGLELEGTALAPETRDLAGGASGEFSLLSAALLGCVAPNGGSVTVLGCIGLELGRISGEGHGVTNPKLGGALWDALRFELGAELVTSSRLTARAGVAVPFTRPEFRLEGLEAFRPGPFGVRALLGIELWP